MARFSCSHDPRLKTAGASAGFSAEHDKVCAQITALLSSRCADVHSSHCHRGGICMAAAARSGAAAGTRCEGETNLTAAGMAALSALLNAAAPDAIESRDAHAAAENAFCNSNLFSQINKHINVRVE